MGSGLAGHESSGNQRQSRPGRDQLSNVRTFDSRITVLFSLPYRGSLKWSEGGLGGVPRTLYQPFLSICRPNLYAGPSLPIIRVGSIHLKNEVQVFLVGRGDGVRGNVCEQITADEKAQIGGMVLLAIDPIVQTHHTDGHGPGRLLPSTV